MMWITRLRIPLFLGALFLVTGGLRGQQAFTVDRLADYPTVTFRLAFHFVARADGLNFARSSQDALVLAHGGHEKLRADVLIYYLLEELNLRFRQALLDHPASRDTRIRFVALRGSDLLASASFYGYRDPVTYLPDALNIVITPYRAGARAPSGSTPGVGSNRIYLYQLLDSYLRGSDNTWDPARVLAHEFGHTRGLDHTFKCDNPCNGVDLVAEEECFGRCASNNAGSTTAGINCFGGSARKLMMGYGSQLHLTRCETEQLWTYILNHPAPYQEFSGPLPQEAAVRKVTAPY